MRRNNTHILCAAGLTASLTMPGARAHGQEALRYSLAGETAAEAMRTQLASLPYTIKSGDFKLLITPSLGFDYNDNINVSHNDPLDDFILRPFVQFTASYPIGERNLLSLDLGVGYDKYFKHNDYSGVRLRTGSQVAFDVFVGDFRFDFHDRFEYIGDSAGNAAVVGNTQYQYFQNIVGLSADWDLQDVTITLGYDHLNYISTTSTYDYLDHATEMFLARAGLKIHPQLTVGVEGSAAPTSYDQPVLNNNVSYSAGAYGIWQPGHNFNLQARFGYTIYDFQQTSLVIPAQNQNTWYGDITIQHQPTEAISYGVSVGHELKLGIQSDLIEDTYFRPSVTWKLLKSVTLNGSIFFEHGNQTGGTFTNEETYNWYGGTIGATYAFMRNLAAGLSYRLTLRSSNLPSQEYTQNLVSLVVTYSPR